MPETSGHPRAAAQRGWASLPPELLHLALQGLPTDHTASACTLVCKAWHAALGTPGAAWASLELALRVDATEASLQASLPRLRAIGALTTSLDFMCAAASRSLDAPSLCGAEERNTLRELAERALALIVPALPRLRACNALDLPLAGPALGPLLQHPALQELQLGLGAEGLEVDVGALQRFERSGAGHLTTLRVRLYGDFMAGEGGPAALLADLTALARVPCLHVDVTPDIQSDYDPHCVYWQSMPEELAALTNLHSLSVHTSSDRDLNWDALPGLSALVHLSCVTVDSLRWADVFPGLSVLPALKQLTVLVARGDEQAPPAENLQFLSRLNVFNAGFDILRAEDGEAEEAVGRAAGAESSWDRALARRSAAQDQAGVKMPLLQRLLLHGRAEHVCCFSWGSMTALTLLCLRDGAGREDVCLPDFPYLAGLLHLELSVKAKLPAQLKHATRLVHLCVVAEGVQFCTAAAATALTGLVDLQLLDLVFEMGVKPAGLEPVHGGLSREPPSSVLDARGRAKVRRFIRRLPAQLCTIVRDQGQPLFLW